MTPRRPVVEMMDELVAEIMRQKTPTERLAIAFGMQTFARTFIRASLRREHPDWSPEQLQQETARRFGLGGNS